MITENPDTNSSPTVEFTDRSPVSLSDAGPESQLRTDIDDVDLSLLKDIKLADIVKTLPPECFQQNPWKAWSLAWSLVVLVGMGFWGLAIAPWYFLPLFWLLTGTGLAGFFNIAHDCGHYSFSKIRWVNDVVGHLMLTPMLYPFYNWRIQHNCHHRQTNKLGREGWRQLYDMVNRTADPYWQPVRVENYLNLNRRPRWTYERVRGYFWWLATIQNWWSQMVVNTSKFPDRERQQIKFSVSVVIVFALIALPALVLTNGIWGLVKFWLIPWLVYHFWFSTTTMIHHTSPGTIWQSGDEWNAVQANLHGTVHCYYPRWVEFLLYDINYHVPHHVAPAIPAYHLRMAHQSLKENWGQYMRDCNFSWSLIQKIIGQCQLYDAENGHYQSFGEVQHLSQ